MEQRWDSDGSARGDEPKAKPKVRLRKAEVPPKRQTLLKVLLHTLEQSCQMFTNLVGALFVVGHKGLEMGADVIGMGVEIVE